VSRSRPLIRLRVFGRAPLDDELLSALTDEMCWRFDLRADLRPFYSEFKDDPQLGPAIRRQRGMRVSCSASLYEFLVIAIVLQNCTVRRSVSMMQSLLERYGTLVAFGDVTLHSFWEPHRVARASEEELRELKVGYRATALKRTAELFSGRAMDERQLRGLPKDELSRRLLSIYGVGPASLSYLLFEVFHHYDAFDVLSPWEQRIYSRLMYGQECVSARRILADAQRRWGRWRMLAAHYLFEDLFARHAQRPIEWLAREIRD